MDNVGDKSGKQFQHFVPDFYLSGWQITVDHKPKRIWVYEKGSVPRHAAIKNIGGEENFYAVKASDGTNDVETIERFLSRGESRAGTVFATIKNRKLLNEKDGRIFAEFLGVLLRRSPFYIGRWKDLVNKFLPGVIDPLLEIAEEIEDKERRDRAIENIEKVAAERRADPESIAKASILEPSDITNFVEKMDWAFFTCPTSKFVTSDNPFVYSIGLGIGDFENGHIIMPISSEISFQARNSTKFDSGYYEINDEDASKINLRIIGHAHKQVFASERSEELQKIVQERIGTDLK